MKKPVLLFLLGCFLTGSASAQMFNPNKKKKKAAQTEATPAKGEAGKGGAGATTTANALPPTFDPKIVTDTRASDAKPRERTNTTLTGKAAEKAGVVENNIEVAKAQLARGEDKVALEFLDKAVKADPKNMKARILRGEARVKRKMYSEASSDLFLAKKELKDKAPAELFFWLGRAKQEQDKDKEAITNFDECIKLKADWADAYYWRGFSYSEMDQLKDKACPDFEKAAELGSELGNKAKGKYCKK